MNESSSTNIQENLLIDYYKYANLITAGKDYTSEKQFINDLILVNTTYMKLKHKKRKIDPLLYKYFISPSYVKDALSEFKKKKIYYFFSRKYKNSIALFCSQQDYSIKQCEEIRSFIFNYYIKSNLEKDTKRYDIGRSLLSEYNEKVSIVNEFEILSKGLIKNAKNKDYFQSEVKQLEIILKKCMNDIAILFTSKDQFEKNESPSSQLKKDRIVLTTFFPELFHVGRKEHYAFNELLLNLYRLFQKDENKVYMPKIISVLNFMNDHTLAKNPIATLSSGTLRKKIKDLIKRDLNRTNKKHTDNINHSLLIKSIKLIHN